MIGLLLLKHIYGLSDESVCERWVYDPYFQHFTGEEFFQHEFPHERSVAEPLAPVAQVPKLELLLAESLRVAHAAGALRSRDLKRVTVDTTVQPKNITFPLACGGQRARAPGPKARRAAAAILSARRQARRDDIIGNYVYCALGLAGSSARQDQARAPPPFRHRGRDRPYGRPMATSAAATSRAATATPPTPSSAPSGTTSASSSLASAGRLEYLPSGARAPAIEEIC